jgi:hypothetical protein
MLYFEQTGQQPQIMPVDSCKIFPAKDKIDELHRKRRVSVCLDGLLERV